MLLVYLLALKKFSLGGVISVLSGIRFVSISVFIGGFVPVGQLAQVLGRVGTKG